MNFQKNPKKEEMRSIDLARRNKPVMRRDESKSFGSPLVTGKSVSLRIFYTFKARFLQKPRLKL